MTSDPIRPPKTAARGTTGGELNRGFTTAYEHLHRFGGLANTGGVAACLGFLSATATLDGVEKAILIPLGLFVSGVLAVWLSLFVINERLAEALGENVTNDAKPWTRKVAELLAKPFDNGALFLAPLVLFCLGVAAGFVVILFA